MYRHGCYSSSRWQRLCSLWPLLEEWCTGTGGTSITPCWVSCLVPSRLHCVLTEPFAFSWLGVFMGFTVTGVVTQVIKVCITVRARFSWVERMPTAFPTNTDDSGSPTSGHAQPVPSGSGSTRPSSLWSFKRSRDVHLNRHAHLERRLQEFP
jgi:hypothetical protein